MKLGIIRTMAALGALLGVGVLQGAPAASWIDFSTPTTGTWGTEASTVTFVSGDYTLTVTGTYDSATGVVTLTAPATVTGTAISQFSILADLDIADVAANVSAHLIEFEARSGDSTTRSWLRLNERNVNLGHNYNGTNDYTSTAAWGEATRRMVTVTYLTASGSTNIGTNAYLDGTAAVANDGLRWSNYTYATFDVGFANVKLRGLYLYNTRLANATAVGTEIDTLARQKAVTLLRLGEDKKPLLENYTGNIESRSASSGRVTTTQDTWVNFTSDGNVGASGNDGLTASGAAGSRYNVLLTRGTFSGTPASAEGFTPTNDSSSTMVFNGITDAASLNLRSGRWKVAASDKISKVHTVYLLGGQLWAAGALSGLTTRFVLGGTDYTGTTDTNVNGAALCIDNVAVTLPQVEVIEAAKIAQAGNTLTISQLSGSGDLSFAVRSGTPNVTIGTAPNYTGTLTKGVGTVTLNTGVVFNGTLSRSAGTLELGGGTAGHTIKALNATGNLAVTLGNNNADSIQSTIQSLTVGNGATVTVTQSSWNNILNLGALSGSGKLKWEQGTTHYTPSTVRCSGDGSGFTGTIEVKRTRAVETRNYQQYLVVDSENALGSAVVDITSDQANCYSTLALNAATVTVGTLSGTEYAYVLSGFTHVAGNDNTHQCGKRTSDSTTRTLKLMGAQNGKWLGEIADNVNIEKSGTGTWEVGDGCLGSGTVTLREGTLRLPVQSAPQTIAVEGGAITFCLTDAQLASGTVQTNVTLTGSATPTMSVLNAAGEEVEADIVTAEDGQVSVTVRNIIVWRPTDTNLNWTDSALWSGNEVVLTGTVTVDFSALTANANAEVAIPNTAAYRAMVFRSSTEQMLTINVSEVAESTSLGRLTVEGNVRVKSGALSLLTEGVEVGDGKVLEIEVAEAEESPLPSVISGSGTLRKVGPGTLSILATMTLSVGTLDISAGEVLIKATDNSWTTTLSSVGAVTGSGKLTFERALPQITNSIAIPGISAPSWRGTVKIKEQLDSGKELRLDLYGHTGSVVEVENANGHFGSRTISSPIRLTGEGLQINNGSSSGNGNTVKMAKLIGDGKFKNPIEFSKSNSRDWVYNFLIGDISEFEGVFDLQNDGGGYHKATANLKIQIGSTESVNRASALKNITIVGNVTAPVKEAWNPVSDGAIRVTEGSTLKFGPTAALTQGGAISGEGKLEVENAKAVTLTGDLSGFTGAFKVGAAGSLTLDTSSPMALSGGLEGAGALNLGGSNGTPTVSLSGLNEGYAGVITVASGAVLTNAGSSATVPFGKGEIKNNGIVKMVSTNINNGQLPPISGTGNVEVKADCKIPAELTVTGSLQIDENCTVTLDCNTDENDNKDFEDRTPKIEGPSVSLATGAKIALGTNKTTGKLTIPAERTLSGAGTIGVPVTLNGTLATGSSLTFEKLVEVAEGATLSGAATFASGSTLKSLAAMTIPVTFEAGSTIEIVGESGFLQLSAKVTLPKTGVVKVKPAKSRALLLSVLGGLRESAFALDESVAADYSDYCLGTPLYDPTQSEVAQWLMLLQKPRVTEGVEASDEVLSAVARVVAEDYGWAITVSSADARGKAKLDGAALFGHVTTLSSTTVEGSKVYVAEVSYDFGVDWLTVTADDRVVLRAKVASEAVSDVGGGSVPAKILPGTTVKVQRKTTNAEGNPVWEDVASSVLTEDEIRALGQTPGDDGVRYLAIARPSGVDTFSYRVVATSGE